MANSFSTNTGISALPEYDQAKDSAAYAEFLRLRNAIVVLQAAIDGLGGAGGVVVTHSTGTLTNHATLLGNGAGDIRAGTLGLTGQVWTGVTGADPIWAAPGSSSLTFNTQTASYTLVLADCDNNHWVEMNVAGANTLTIPPNGTVAAPIGTTVLWSQLGAGQITFNPGAGVTILQASSLTSRAQNSCGGLTKKATNTWYLYGDTT